MAVSWSQWATLGQPQQPLHMPFVQNNHDGRLEVFALGAGEVFAIWQLFPNAGWASGWLCHGELPGAEVRALVVGNNADGRQEIFALGDDGALWHRWQVRPNNGWSQWQTLGAPTSVTFSDDRFVVGNNEDGRQEIFSVGSDGNVWQKWQTSANGGWSHWNRLGQPPVGLRAPDQITVGHNIDGRQELFVMGADDALWHVWQVGPNIGWSQWESLGKPRDTSFPEPKERDLSEPVVQENPDGHLEVFAPGNQAFCNRWQESPNSAIWRQLGWNAKPSPQPDVGIVVLEAALDTRRHRVEVVGIGDDGNLWHAWQIPREPFWSNWERLASPDGGIRATEGVAVGRNGDGRLEVFLVGGDGAVWHVWQTE